MDRGVGGRNCAQGGCGIPVAGDCASACQTDANGNFVNCDDGGGTSESEVLTTYLNTTNEVTGTDVYLPGNPRYSLDGVGVPLLKSTTRNSVIPNGMSFSSVMNTTAGTFFREASTGSVYSLDSRILGSGWIKFIDADARGVGVLKMSMTGNTNSLWFTLTDGSVEDIYGARCAPPYVPGSVDSNGVPYGRIVAANTTLAITVDGEVLLTNNSGNHWCQGQFDRASSIISHLRYPNGQITGDAVSLEPYTDGFINIAGEVWSVGRDGNGQMNLANVDATRTPSAASMMPAFVLRDGRILSRCSQSFLHVVDVLYPGGGSWPPGVRIDSTRGPDDGVSGQITLPNGTAFNIPDRAQGYTADGNPICTSGPVTAVSATTMAPFASCGNGVCDVLESAASCSSDCGPTATTDVSRYHPTRMSSALTAGDFGGAATDGDSLSVAKTSAEKEPWWSVDLGANNTLTKVIITPSGTLSNFVIEGALQATPNNWTTLVNGTTAISAAKTYTVSGVAHFLRVRRLAGTGTQTLAIADFSAIGKVTGPVAIWPMDEAGGTITTSNLAGTFNGTPNGTIAYSQPPVKGTGKSLAFSGAQYAEVPYAATLNPSSTFSVEAWFNVSASTGSNQSILTSRNGSPQRGYTLYVTPSNTLELSLGTGSAWSVVSGGAITLGQDYHVAATFSSGVAKLYVNGVLVASKSTSFSANTTRPLRIGAGTTETTASLFFKGRIDDVTVWNRELSAAEAAARFEEGRKPAAL